MDIMLVLKAKLSDGEWNKLMEYIETQKDEAYSEGFDQGIYTQSFNNTTY